MKRAFAAAPRTLPFGAAAGARRSRLNCPAKRTRIDAIMEKTWGTARFFLWISRPIRISAALASGASGTAVFLWELRTPTLDASCGSASVFRSIHARRDRAAAHRPPAPRRWPPDGPWPAGMDGISPPATSWRERWQNLKPVGLPRLTPRRIACRPPAYEGKSRVPYRARITLSGGRAGHPFAPNKRASWLIGARSRWPAELGAGGAACCCIAAPSTRLPALGQRCPGRRRTAFGA